MKISKKWNFIMVKIKENIKKILLSSLVVSSTLSPSLSFANEGAKEIMDGGRGSQEERAYFENFTESKQIEMIESDPNLSEEDKAAFINKIKGTESVPIISSVASKVLSVPYFKQERGHYCGPATTKQTLQFVKGSSPSQDTLCKILGTTPEKGTDGRQIVKYLNSSQNKINYVIANPKSNDHFTTLVNSALRSYNSTPIARIKFRPGEGWKYKTGGHFLNISGQKMSGSTVMHQLTDPYIQWIDKNNTSGKFYERSNLLYKGIMNHFGQHIYY
ncbi:C39 family peptidase [Faecalimicrobium sp. JNUCC 81]